MAGQELDFIAELDAAVSNIGSDVVWIRTVGGVKLMISPLTMVGQEKVTDVITKMTGSTIVAESKRVTLSHAIVGVGDFDLRQYRGSAVFPSKGRDGKQAYVTLDRYMYDKIGTWGSQFVDDVFVVYSDLLESLQRDNLKDIKFENVRSPLDELVELEARVRELRQQLNMPGLIEREDDGEDGDRADTEPPDERPEEASAGPSGQPFDPFQLVPQDLPAAGEPVRPSPEDESGLEEAIRRSRSPQVRESPDVLDVPMHRAVTQPPVIDPAPVARNPRFAGRG